MLVTCTLLFYVYFTGCFTGWSVFVNNQEMFHGLFHMYMTFRPKKNISEYFHIFFHRAELTSGFFSKKHFRFHRVFHWVACFSIQSRDVSQAVSHGSITSKNHLKFHTMFHMVELSLKFGYKINFYFTGCFTGSFTSWKHSHGFHMDFTYFSQGSSQ